jgi:5-methylcytosine-specific restriction enzyme subunit McrC
LADVRVIELEEYQEKRLPESQLSADVAMELYHRCSNWLDIEFPTAVNDRCYVLRPRDFVGHFPVSKDLLLRVSPKVPIGNLFRMLEYAYNLKSFQFLQGETACDSLDDLFERLASILAKRVLDRLRRGLFRDYIDNKEHLPYVRGRICVLPSVRAGMRGSTRLVCDYQDHTADLEDNQILVATLYRLPRVGIKRPDVRRQVRHAYRGLVGAVEVRPVCGADCVNRTYHRLNEDYKPMHALCRFFLDACGPDEGGGDREFIPYSLRMSQLFELFVANWLSENLPSHLHIEPHCNAGTDERGRFIFDIDLVLRDARTGDAIAVLDTKYKRDSRPGTSDVQQVVAYATTLRTDRAFLIYPSTETRSEEFAAGDVRVRSLTFDVSGAPDRSGSGFLASLTGHIRP